MQIYNFFGRDATSVRLQNLLSYHSELKKTMAQISQSKPSVLLLLLNLNENAILFLSLCKGMCI